ncbi:hypothetical protein [Lacticaseibacillus paracasei]|uniref:hypothetical protein n=1 Tax=Lacticaseibacillus paracasei TaxID=1597 RepID=UPI0033941209
MNSLLIKHQLEESRPVREYKAQVMLKRLYTNPRNSSFNTQLYAIRQAKLLTDSVVNKVLIEIQRDKTAFCRERCGLYKLREERINNLVRTCLISSNNKV